MLCSKIAGLEITKGTSRPRPRTQSEIFASSSQLGMGDERKNAFVCGKNEGTKFCSLPS